MPLDPNVKSKDVALWQAWKQSNSSNDLQKLINQMTPIIMREVNKWAASMSRSLLEAEGKRLAVEAFKSYNPNQGTTLSTYVASRLPKLSRIVYSNQNVARLSETKSLLFHAYSTAHNELIELHGRDPTGEELCDRLGWSKRKLSQFQQQSNRRELIESEEHPTYEQAEDHLVDFIYHDLTPLQKQIFEYRTGYLGKPKLQGDAICKKLKITQGQLSYQLNTIVQVAEQAKATHAKHA